MISSLRFSHRTVASKVLDGRYNFEVTERKGFEVFSYIRTKDSRM
jgi:hypothetical protein